MEIIKVQETGKRGDGITERFIHRNKGSNEVKTVLSRMQVPGDRPQEDESNRNTCDRWTVGHGTDPQVGDHRQGAERSGRRGQRLADVTTQGRRTELLYPGNVYS